MKSTWKKYLLYAAYILIASGLLYGLLQIVLAGYTASWTGFGERTLSNGDIVGEKTLWDWMELLIIPFVLAIGAFFLNRSERAVERETANKRAELEREIAKKRQQEAALQAYLSQMSELLLEKKLRTTEVQEVRDVARTLTISVMRGLDRDRNNLIIQFLREAKLVMDNNSILNGADMGGMNLEGLDLGKIYLQNANLQDVNLQKARLVEINIQGSDLTRANLHKAWLTRANLQKAQLNGADMREADLHEATLQKAELICANMQKANLYKTDLQEATLMAANLQNAWLNNANMQETNLETADLQGAIFDEAYLTGANLKKTNLKGTKITEEQLAQAKSLKGATMPDGTIHE